MTTERTIGRWSIALITVLALAGFVSLSQAQPTIVLSNDTSQSSAFYDADPTTNTTWTWIPTNGPNGGGCMMGTIDGTNTIELDPAFNVAFATAPYYQVTIQVRVDAASGTQGNLGSGGYGHSQLAFRDASFSYDGVGYAAIFPPAANNWVTYSYAVPGANFNVAHLQYQLQGATNYSANVILYIGDVTIIPIPNPAVLAYFTNDTVTGNWQNYGLNATWDGTIDSPYVNPVTLSAPVSITPPGSVKFQASIPKNYQGGQLNLGFAPIKFQNVDFDLYYDGPTPDTNDYGGFQIFIANGQSPYNWQFIGNASFNAGMIGTWTHFSLPCASTGITNAAGFAVQATPGSGPGTNAAITFHIDNIQVWNPIFHPTLSKPLPPTTGGVLMALDDNTTNNVNDQEGIGSPTTNNTSDFFWANHTPAAYSVSVTNAPSPASAPQFDTHIYVLNGDSETAYSTGQGNNLWPYNQTYSGAPYNVPDFIGFHVQNGTNGGVVAFVEWKTNLPNANAPTNISFAYPSMANANGTWTFSFTDNTHGSITAPDSSVNSFVLPDFVNDPNYAANFTPATSQVQYGIWKAGNTNNNSRSITVTSVSASNTVAAISDSFGGPGLTANFDWLVCEYYQFAADRAIWQPSGTGHWFQWNTTAPGFVLESSTGVASGWTNAGVSYSYVDNTGTNTLGAVPTTNLPAGNAAFFRLKK